MNSYWYSSHYDASLSNTIVTELVLPADEIELVIPAA